MEGTDLFPPISLRFKQKSPGLQGLLTAQASLIPEMEIDVKSIFNWEGFFFPVSSPSKWRARQFALPIGPSHVFLFCCLFCTFRTVTGWWDICEVPVALDMVEERQGTTSVWREPRRKGTDEGQTEQSLLSSQNILSLVGEQNLHREEQRWLKNVFSVLLPNTRKTWWIGLTTRRT